MVMNRLSEDHSEVLDHTNEWNSTWFDLFKINKPNEVLDLYGIMRFYFQNVEDKSEENVYMLQVHLQHLMLFIY